MEIVRLGERSAEGKSSEPSGPVAYWARQVQSMEELQSIQRATLYGGNPSQQASLQFHEREEDEPSETAYAVFRENAVAGTHQSTIHNDLAEQMVGGVWVATNRFVETDLHLQVDLGKHQRWLFAARLIPDERRRGAYSVLLRRLLSLETKSDSIDCSGATDGGASEIWAAINPLNHRSRRAHARFQIASAGKIYVLRIGPLAVC